MSTDTPTLPDGSGELSPVQLCEALLRAGDRDGALAMLNSVQKVQPDEGRVLLSLAVIKSADAIIRCLFDDKGLKVDKDLLLPAVEVTAQNHQTLTAFYLSARAAEAGASLVECWGKILRHAVSNDLDLIITRVVGAAKDQRLALNNLFEAAMLAKTYTILPKLLERGADPNTGGGLALAHIVGDPPRQFYQQQKEYNALLTALFDHGYNDMQLADDMLTVAAQKMIDGGQRAETVVLLLEKGADAKANGSEALNVITKHYEGLNDDETAGLWRDIFDEAHKAQVEAEKRRFAGFFGGKYCVYDLLQPLGHGETGLMVAAKAGMLKDVLDDASASEKEMIVMEDLTALNDRQQSVLGIAADSGQLKSLLRPDHWRGREKQVLETAFAHLSEQRLSGGGWQDLQAFHTRSIIVSGANRKFKL